MNSLAQELVAGDARIGREQSDARAPRRLPIPDAQLVALAHAGVAGIEEHVHARLAAVVGRVIWTLLGPDAEHEDVVHDTFLRILRGIGGLRDPERLEDWAARVAINTVRNELRRRRVRRWVSWNAFEDPNPPSYAPDDDGRELVARAYDALARLPTQERVLLTLKLFENSTLPNLAAATGSSLTTTKRRLRDARARFLRIAARDPLLSSWLEASTPASGSDDDE